MKMTSLHAKIIPFLNRLQLQMVPNQSDSNIPFPTSLCIIYLFCAGTDYEKSSWHVKIFCLEIIHHTVSQEYQIKELPMYWPFYVSWTFTGTPN